MSKIEYKLSDLATYEQIQWLNNLACKILDCGNDEICIIDENNKYTYLGNLILLIKTLHINNKNKTITLIRKYTRDIKSEN